MDNVVSIFSGKTPCDNLEIPNDKFYELVSTKQFQHHLLDCGECSVRVGLLARRNLNKFVSEIIDDIHDD